MATLLTLKDKLKNFFNYSVPQKMAQVASSPTLNRAAQGFQNIRQTPAKQFFLPTALSTPFTQRKINLGGQMTERLGQKITPSFQAPKFQPLPLRATQFAASMPGAILQSYGQTAQRLSTPQGRQQIKTGFSQLPQQIGKGQLLTALGNPATQTALDLTDFLPGGLLFAGGLKAVTREGAEKVGKEGLEKVGKKVLKNLPTQPKGVSLYDGPEQLRPLARNVVWGKMSKEQFLTEFNKGLKNQNLTVRETAQKTLSEIKRNGMTPESFYDRYGSSAIRIAELEKKMSRSTGNPQQYETYRKEWDNLRSVFNRTPEEMKVAQKALDDQFIPTQPKGVPNKYWTKDLTNYQPLSKGHAPWGTDQAGFNISKSGKIDLTDNQPVKMLPEQMGGVHKGYVKEYDFPTHRNLQGEFSGLYSFKDGKAELYLYPNAEKNLTSEMKKGMASLIGVHDITADTPVISNNSRKVLFKLGDIQPTQPKGVTSKVINTVDNNNIPTKDMQVTAKPIPASFDERLAFAKKAGLKDSEIDDFLSLTGRGEIYRNANQYNLESRGKSGFIDLEKVKKAYTDFAESKTLPTQASKGVGEGMHNIENLDVYFKDKYGITADKATKKQYLDVLNTARSDKNLDFVPYKENVFSKVSSSKRGYTKVSSLSLQRPALLYGGKSRGVFTDGFILIEDKSLANKVNDTNINEEIKNLTRSYQREGLSFPVAEKAAKEHSQKMLKEFGEGNYPEWQKILPKTKGVEFKPQAILPGTDDEAFTVLSNGQQQIILNSDKLAFFKKEYPNLKLFNDATLGKTPVQVFNGNKRVGLIMPVDVGIPETLKPDYFPSIKGQPTTLPTQPKGVTAQPPLYDKPIKIKEGVKVKIQEAKPVTKPQVRIKEELKEIPQVNKLVQAQAKQIAKATETSLSSSVVGKPNIPSSKTIISQKDKYAFNVNLTKINTENKEELKAIIKEVTPELEKAKGKKLSLEETVEEAKKSNILQQVTTRDETLKANAEMLKARQRMVQLDNEVTRLAQKGDVKNLDKKMKELIDSLRVVSAEAADRGRKLQSLNIEAGDESLRVQMLKEIGKVETDTDRIIKESANVNWENANDVAKFYRKFIKPNTKEILDEFRYNNMLSNPRTHLRNLYSNLFQTTLTRPLTIAGTGDIKGAGKYYSGVIKNFNEAVDDAVKAFKGETPIEKPDFERISTYKIPRFMTIPTRAMEAGDKFFSKLISGGEIARGADAAKAKQVAEYSLFRQDLKPEGQGKLLNAIDSATEGIYEIGNKIPVLRWFVPFVRTPMNFAKQWVEYSPTGFLTIAGSGGKKEQLAKAMIGSMVAFGGAKLAFDDRTTWATPTDPKEKELFYASGKKPFSFKVGNKWVSMMYAGPFAFALALPAAVKFYQEDNRTALTDTQMDKLTKMTSSMAEFLSGQTFMEGLGNFVSLLKGDADYTLPKNLAYTSSQIIPLQGLVRWISTAIDPIYRKPDGFVEQVKSNIPFVSKTLESYKMPNGEPSTRESRNLITPFDITTERPEYVSQQDERIKQLQENALVNQATKEIEKAKTGSKQIGDKLIYWDNEQQKVRTKTIKVEAGAEKTTKKKTAKSKSAKRITISKVSGSMPKISKSSPVKIQTLKIPATPGIKKHTIKAIKITGGEHKTPQYKIKKFKNTLTEGFTKLA